MLASCTKCAGLIPVEGQLIQNMLALGDPLSFAHDVCPTAEVEPGEAVEDVPRRFRLQLLGYELSPDAAADPAAGAFNVRVLGSDLLAGMGETVRARNFAEAVNGPLTTWLATRAVSHEGRMISAWEKFQEQAAFADLPPPPASM